MIVKVKEIYGESQVISDNIQELPLFFRETMAEIFFWHITASRSIEWRSIS